MYLVSNPINVQYLSGFKSSNAFIIQNSKQSHLFTDSRYIEAAKKIKGYEVHLLDKNYTETIKKVISKEKTLYFESDYLTYDKALSWKKMLRGKCQLKEFPDKKKLINIRSVKTKSEIAKIKKAQTITKKAIIKAQKLINKNSTEQSIAWKIKTIMHDLGAEDISFEPIVAFGEHSSIPHHENTNIKFKKNDIVLIDAGAKYKGYCGDMTRTFLPKDPSLEMICIYKAVKEAQKIAIEKLDTSLYDIKLSSISKAVRKYFKKEGLEEYFTHSLGHGVGLEIHEEPRLSPKSKSTYQQGQVFSIEPGLYLPGKFGVRIEDLYFA